MNTKTISRLAWGLALTAFVGLIGLADTSPADADPDTDFSTELHGYGIYGPRDYNAWLGKISCERSAAGVDRTDISAAKFLMTNLPRGTTIQQSWQFRAAALSYYCPELLPAPPATPTP